MEPYRQLEIDWSKWNDLDPDGMVCCSSGTAALHLSLEALQLPQGSKCICPDLTMIACPRAITLAGLEPVFVDCDDTLNLDTDLLGQYVDKDYHLNDKSPAAVMMVHIYGRRCKMSVFDGAGVDEFTRHQTYLIEDLAEAHGIKPHPETDAACYSFYKNKIVAGEEGGAVWFRNPEHAKLARQLRSLGFTDAHDFNHIPRGHNYRMSNAHAKLVIDSIGYANINMLDRWQQIERLDNACPDEWRQPKHDAPWVYDLRIPGMSSEQQDRVVKALNTVGITARHCFKPCHLQSEYAACQMLSRGKPFRCRSYYASQEVIYLALIPGRPRIDKIVFSSIKEALEKSCA